MTGVPHAWPVGVVEHDDPADLQHSVQAEEVHHHVIKPVRAVDECEIDFDAGGLEAGQRLVRRQGLQFDETRIFCSFQMLDADALPIAELIRVDDDVMLGPDFRERFADVKRRNARRTTDLDADSRL